MKQITKDNIRTVLYTPTLITICVMVMVIMLDAWNNKTSYIPTLSLFAFFYTPYLSFKLWKKEHKTRFPYYHALNVRQLALLELDPQNLRMFRDTSMLGWSELHGGYELVALGYPKKLVISAYYDYLTIHFAEVSLQTKLMRYIHKQQVKHERKTKEV